MIREVHVKSILNRHKRRDLWFLDDYSINPYYGCSFGCIYCYTRGSKYGASGPVAIKVNAVDVLRRQLELRARKGQYGIIAISTSTEPYQVFEMEYGITGQILEVVEEYRFPVHCLQEAGAWCTISGRETESHGKTFQRGLSDRSGNYPGSSGNFR